MEDLDSVWSFLDREYGNTRKLAWQRMEDLSKFYYTNEARTDGDKLLELHQAWRGVYLDLKQVGEESSLDYLPYFNGFVKKFPDVIKREFVRFLLDKSNESQRRSEVLTTFLEEQREVVRRLKDFKEDDEERSVGDSQEGSVGDSQEESVGDAQEEKEESLPDEYVPTEVVAESVDEIKIEEGTRILRTEEDLVAYAGDAKWRRKVGLPEQPVLNLPNTENLGVEAMESSPTDSVRSSPVRVTESPGRGSVSKGANPDIVYNKPGES